MSTRIAASAAYRIAAIYALVLSVTVVALGTAVYHVAVAEVRLGQDVAVATESSDLKQEYTHDGLDALKHAMNAREKSDATNAFGYALFDAGGRRIAGNFAIPRPLAGLHDIVIDDPREGPDPYRVQATDLAGGERLVIAADLEPVETTQHMILTLCLLAFGLTIAIGIFGAFLLGRYLRRKLERIGATARAIALGDMDRRIPIGTSGGGDEFDELGAALNAMLDRIALLLENLRQVSSDVAHDLRTPLARLRGELDLAQDPAIDLDERDAAVRRALAASDTMLHLFGAILRLSEIESGRLARPSEVIDLSDLTVELCDSYLPAVADGGRVLRFDVQPGLRIRGDRELMAQALINLLDNAQIHTPLGTEITVTAIADAERVKLMVADTGPGVARQDRTRILHRFVRLEASRSTPGHGLGLNLVSAIVALHGGTLTIEDNAPGLVATIVLSRVRGLHFDVSRHASLPASGAGSIVGTVDPD